MSLKCENNSLDHESTMLKIITMNLQWQKKLVYTKYESFSLWINNSHGNKNTNDTNYERSETS